MAYASFVDRRAFLKWAGALPLFGYIAAQDLYGKAWAAVGKNPKDNIYTRVGVKPLINARGVWTYLSGQLELPAVRAAKEQAAMHFVDIYELNRAVGKRLAEIAGSEAGMVTSGAAGAMAAATAACIAGTDPAKVWQLPDTTGLKSEVIMFGGRSVFDSAIRLAGGKLVVTRTFDELQSAINGNTAMVYMDADREGLEKALAITKKANVPLLADHAAGIPPFDNLKLYAKMGCDLYTFSGGKGLRGPQCSGVLLGRKDLIEAAMANYSPWEGSVCRPLKVGKEEIMGVLAAVEWWAQADLKTIDKDWRARLGRIATLIGTVPGVKAEITQLEEPYVDPKLKVSWDEQAWGFTIADCDKKLREGEPRIEVLTLYNNPCVVPAARGGETAKVPSRPDEMQIVAQTLQPGEELVIGRRLREILTAARKGAKTA